jgi:hypothetical protein
MRFHVRLLFILAGASCASGCAPAAPGEVFDEAVLRFARQQSCPADRLQVKHVEVPLSDLVESKPSAVSLPMRAA